MDYVLVGAAIFFLIGLVILVMPPATISNKFVAPEKRCPPHKWDWQDIIDSQGVKQGERMVCAHCGPLAKILNRGDD